MCINTGGWGYVEPIEHPRPLDGFHADYMRGEQDGASDRRQGLESFVDDAAVEANPADGWMVGYRYGWLHGFGYDRIEKS